MLNVGSSVRRSSVAGERRRSDRRARYLCWTSSWHLIMLWKSLSLNTQQLLACLRKRSLVSGTNGYHTVPALPRCCATPYVPKYASSSSRTDDRLQVHRQLMAAASALMERYNILPYPGLPGRTRLQRFGSEETNDYCVPPMLPGHHCLERV